MTVERAVEIYAAINLAVFGVSHIVRPHVWVDFFVWFTFPRFGLRKLEIPSHERARMFVAPGVLFVAVAALPCWHLWFGA